MKIEIKKYMDVADNLRQIIKEKDKIIMLTGLKLKELIQGDENTRLRMLENDFE
jgi:hypothetical protein